MFSIYGVATTAHAQIPSGLELNGYAWSSNIGWISLNCRTGGVDGGDICGDSDYKVTVAPNRSLAGYAWSPNIGWIRFSNLGSMDGHSGFPSGSGTVNASARLSDPDYQDTTLEGWIRVCGGTASISDYCNNGVLNENSGGWDGWISLKGTNYEVDTANFGSPQYVWGGEVVGWVDMSSYVDWYSSTSITGTGCTITTIGEGSCEGSLSWSFPTDISNPTVVRTSPASPAISLTGQNATGQSVTLLLGGNTFGARSGTSGTNLATHTISAVCGSGLMSDGSVCQPTDITIDELVANPSIVRRGRTAEISWRLSTVPVDGQCTITGPDIDQAVTTQNGSITTNPLTATARVTLTCGGNSRDVTITVVPAFNEV